MSTTAAADPATEIRITALHATRGLNFWSKRPVIRMDLSVGAFDEISSAKVKGFTEALVGAMPGLVEHRCSIGARGGFITRLKRGTYAPHIIEHIALELQTMIGHEVGYGRTRGGDVEGEYTLVFEHRHEQVGLRAAALSLEIVQRAFAGGLDTVQPAVQELKALAETPDTPPLHQRVFCGITGGTARPETQQELVARLTALGRGDELVIDVSPAYLLQAGLPYDRSELAIVLDVDPLDVPDRYRDPERAQRLMSIVADAVKRDGFVICPAKEWEVQEYAREEDCRVAIFSTDDDITWKDQRVAAAIGVVRDGRIVLEQCGDPWDAGALRPDVPAAAQVAAALAEYVLRAPCGDGPDE
jgi:cyanophycin synthetase